MRHWQDRGEVLDSDDENVSLDSGCSEHPRKRMRLSNDEEQNVTCTKHDGQDRKECTHSERVATVGGEQTVDVDVSRSTPCEALTVQEDQPESLVLAEKDDSAETILQVDMSPNRAERSNSPLGAQLYPCGDVDNLLPRSSTSRSSSGRAEAQWKGLNKSSSELLIDRITDMTDNVLTTTQSSSPQIQLISTSTRATSGSETKGELATWGHSQELSELRTRAPSPVSTSKRLPLLGVVIPTYKEDGIPQVEDILSSGLSSPMSDRDISPPPEFRKQIPSSTSVRMPPVDRDAERAAAALAAALKADAHEPTVRRRALRARKELQLHPYLYEKAQYTKQWRSRGLQPVHYRIADDRGAETQDSFNNDHTQSQEQTQLFSSSLARSDIANDNDMLSTKAPGRIVHDVGPGIGADEDELPDLTSILNAAQHDDSIRRKRRKLIHPTRARSSSKQRLLDTDVDEFAVPLSPPPTSSDSMNRARTAPRFRLPYGMSPATRPLPTPQISSEDRPWRRDSSSMSDFESPPRSRLRAFDTRRPMTSATVAGLADEEPESESESDHVSSQESPRLNRVKKRIKGVLPASWLKIDLQAQKSRLPLSPSYRHQPGLLPSAPKPSTKGVAQRVTHGRTASSIQANPILISDLEDSDDSAPLAPPPDKKQTKLHNDAEQHRLVILREESVDEEYMEVDRIDPMFPSINRLASKRIEPKKRQPRIDDVFRDACPEQLQISEGRRGLSHQKKANRKVRSDRRINRSSRSGGTHQIAPLLSIGDISSSPSRAKGGTPQFVRLAHRQARGRADHGRHSPTRKIIRLATKADTDDAIGVLDAWRSGALVQRSSTVAYRRLTSTPPQRNTTEKEFGHELGRSLRDITNRCQRSSLSPPKRDPGDHKIMAPATHRPHRQHFRHQRQLVEPLRPSGESEQTLTRTVSTKQPLNRRPKPHFRTAQLETVELQWDQDHHEAAFQRRINCLTEAVHRTRRHPFREGNHSLQRYLESGAGPFVPNPLPMHVDMTRGKLAFEANLPVQHSGRPRRPRKRLAQHIDAGAYHYRQPDEPLPQVFDDNHEPWRTDSAESNLVLNGLGPTGTPYAVHFDAQPLSLGTYFHQSTFVGDGDFAAALKLKERDLSIATGHYLSIQLGDDISCWSTWTEDVANDIARIPGLLPGHSIRRREMENGTSAEPAELQSANYIFRSIIRYYIQYLHFSDLIDRRMCVQHTIRFVQDMIDLLETMTTNELSLHDTKARMWQYTLVVAKMAVLLSADAIIDTDLRRTARTAMVNAARGLVRQVFPQGFQGLRVSYEDNRLRSKREAGFTDNDEALTTVLILHHTLADGDGQESTFWTTLDSAYVDFSSVYDVRALDSIWQNIFTILPALEVDAFGVLHVGSRFNSPVANWALTKRLLDHTFKVFTVTDSARRPGVNDYIRAVLTRCHHLLVSWGWWSCEPMLITIFDFFARRSFAKLHDEPSRGSPAFLREGATFSDLEPTTEDPAFHIFLKVMTTGILGMRQHYTDKKIGSIAFRFIPAHGREYRKEAEVEQNNLDALCNHLDLLCTLYRSLPATHRPPINQLQGLIDHSTSHREACRLSVRLWSNITLFQITSEEPTDRLRPLASWFQEILQVTFVQYRLARSEAEHDFELAKSTNTSGITQDMMEATIACNQRQIAVTLVDALAGLGSAIRSANQETNAAFMVEESGYWKVFETLDLSERRLLPVFGEAIRLTRTCLEVHSRFRPAIHHQATGEDSQEYGDFSVLHELVAGERSGCNVTANVPGILYEPVGRLVSNIFGADNSLDDVALASLVDVWVQIAEANGRSNTTCWASYLDNYSPHSWSQLRHTEQKRKFTPYILACIVGKIGDDFYELRGKIMGAWLSSLLEREALLKYQHVLTTALLNEHSEDDLLYNLPFSKGRRSQTFDISLDDLRQRRIALVACILSNIRDHLDRTTRERPRAIPDLRQTYDEMLQQAMRVMKDGYLELQTTTQSVVADSTVQGAYVNFVQQIVGLLQQYATGICKIDSFFTESSAFPLPITDRTYVVGRLRSYSPKLSEPGTRKQLASYVQSVSERAAVDNEQKYLVDQLYTAVDGTFAHSKSKVPSLQQVLLTAILPVYIASALSEKCSWLLAMPIMRAARLIVRNLVYNVNLRDREDMDNTLSNVEAIIRALHNPLEHAVLNPGLLDVPHVQKVIGLAFDLAKSAWMLCDHCERLSHAKLTLTHHLHKLRRYAFEINISMTGSGEDELLQMPVPRIVEYVDSWPDTTKFVEDQLQAAFRPVKDGGHWTVEDGQYFLQKDRQPRREVVQDLSDDGDHRADLLRAIESFQESYDMIFARVRSERTEVRNSMIDLAI